MEEREGLRAQFTVSVLEERGGLRARVIVSVVGGEGWVEGTGYCISGWRRGVG